MTKTRPEAFSDGVIAIIITIMVLELKIPHGTAWQDLYPLWPVLVSYVLSFIIIAIYWGNHHHLLHTIGHVNSKIIWAFSFALLAITNSFYHGMDGRKQFQYDPGCRLCYSAGFGRRCLFYFVEHN